MSRIAYVNGRYVPHGEAAVHIEDRGYQFADGVYEVIWVRDGRLIDEAGHLDRLERSLRELSIAMPMARRVICLVLRQMMRRNRIVNGIVYCQITRGVARRDFAFPVGVVPSMVMTARPLKRDNGEMHTGVTVITIPDIRWARRDIKTVGLLGQALGKQQAKQAGAYEAWMVDGQGFITEGTSSNAWIVTRQGEIVTRAVSNDILAGITRASVIALARERQMTIVERAFTREEAALAVEAFMTSASALVTPIVRIDGKPVGDGIAGPVAQRMRALYLDYADGKAAYDKAPAA